MNLGKSGQPGSVPSVLVFRTGLLGDTLVALPAISDIRSQFPGHDLVLLTNRDPAAADRVSSWSVLGETGWFDRVYFYEPGLRSFASAWQMFRTAWSLRLERFDHVFSLAGQRSWFQLIRDRLSLQFLIGAKHYHAEARPHFPDRERGASQPRVVREVHRLAGIAQLQPRKSAPVRFQLSIPPHERETADRALAGMAIRTNQSLVAIGPATRMPAKDWPEDRYRALGIALLERFDDLILVVIGDALGRSLGERLCAAWGPRCRNLAGSLSVYGSGAVLARCAAYVGNDSGAMHLAAMVGTPCVAIFSAREAPGRWEPFGEGHIVLRHDTDCAGCMLEACVKEEKKCLMRISVEAVVTAADKIVRDRVIRENPINSPNPVRPVRQRVVHG